MAQHTKARLPVEFETRDRVKDQLRGGESYDTLVNKMVDQYDPSIYERPSQYEPPTQLKSDS